jgi:uridine kinase
VKIDLNKLINSKKPKNGKFYVIAIDGRGGSGKSKLAKYLESILHDFTIINGDDYFEPIENQVVWGAFNNKRFFDDVIEPIKKSNEFVYRPYNWERGPHYLNQKLTIKRGIVIERCYSFGFDADWDLKIWVETPKEICRQRGMARETMPKERVAAAWENVWQPLETEYITKTRPKEIADIVLDGTKNYEEQIG